GRSVLERGAAAWADARVLPAHPRPPRPPSRRRGRGAQARLPVLVPADPRTGLRLPAALADQEEAAPPRDRCRLTEIPGTHEHLVDQPGDGRSRALAWPGGRAR